MEVCCPSLPLHPALSSSITPSLSCHYRTHPSVPCWHLLLFPSFFISSPLEPFLIVFLSSVLFVFCPFLFSFSGRWVVWIKRQTWCTSRLELTVDVSLFLFLLLPLKSCLYFFCFFSFSLLPLLAILPCLSYFPPMPPMLFSPCHSEKWTDELWTTINSIVNGSGFVLADDCACILFLWDSVVH